MTSTFSKIAIIGMQVRVPGANTAYELAELLNNQERAISRFNHASGISPRQWLGVRGVMQNYDSFDHRFFNMSESQAADLDPQHRIIIECAWQALETAGYNPNRLPDRNVGVYASCSGNFGHIEPKKASCNASEFIKNYHNTISIDKDYLATRVSYLLNLTGPSLTVQSGCSSSLVALHLARQALILHETNMAIVSGVSITNPIHEGYFVADGMIFSLSGECNPYAANADGVVGSSGCVTVVLKRYEDAKRDKDHILGLIAGSAINNDGAEKMGYTAPSIDRQQEVINKALVNANLNANDIQFIEGHGTGTFLGDAVELEALNNVYGKNSNPCHLGSLKANIGHLDVASGLAGLSKIVLSFLNNTIYAQPNFQSVSDLLSLNSSIKIATKKIQWPNQIKKRAALSSLGVGGTNVHVILESCKENENINSSIGVNYEFIFSACNKESLRKIVKSMSIALANYNDNDLFNIANTLKCRFNPSESNIYVTASSVDELIFKLDNMQYQYIERQHIDNIHNCANVSFKKVFLPPSVFEIIKFPERNCGDFITETVTNDNHGNLKKEINDWWGVAEKLKSTWEDVLGERPTSVDNNFFESGGSSLLVIQFVQHANQTMQLKLKSTHLYDYPTIQELTDFVLNHETLNMTDSQDEIYEEF